MDYIGVVFALEGALQGSPLLVDLGLSGIQVLISDSHGHILVPGGLYSGADADLPVQGQVRRDFVGVIHRRSVVGHAHRPQPAFGKAVLCSQGKVPSVIVIKILGKCGRGR